MSERDPRVDALYRAAGFSGSYAPGERPALLIVDFCVGFTDPASPLGSDVTAEVERTARLVERAHERRRPVIFTTFVYGPGDAEMLPWLLKVPSLAMFTGDAAMSAIDPRLGADTGDVVLGKKGPSAFHGTPLAAHLAALGVDTLLVAGATTSGCVRASVVDAVQHGYRTFVLADCVADRASGPHEANLFDMTAKYAEPLDIDGALAYLTALPA